MFNLKTDPEESKHHVETQQTEKCTPMPDTVSASSKARTKKSQTVEEQLHDSLDSPGEVGVKLSATDGIELMLAKINGL